MDWKFLVKFMEDNKVPTITRKYHTYLTYYGLDQEYTYILKEGIIKTSIILKNGREYNISYICTPDIVSLLGDEVSNYTTAPFNVRIESEEAIFYKIPRVKFWKYVDGSSELQNYVKEYYRCKLSESIYSRQIMTMNSRKGAICAFLYRMIEKFGKKQKVGYLIDFPITNEELSGFCGISTRNSTNRILNELKRDKVIDIVDKKIHLLDIDYLFNFAAK